MKRGERFLGEKGRKVFRPYVSVGEYSAKMHHISPDEFIDLFMRVFIFSLIIGLISQQVMGQAELDSLLNQLEQTMAQRADFDKVKNDKIANIKSLLLDPEIIPEQTYHLNNQIIKEYEYYLFDSAFHYLKLNLNLSQQLNHPVFLNETKLNLSKLLASSGRYKEAVDILDGVARNILTKKLLIHYYNSYENVYENLYFYALADESNSRYYQLHQSYTDSLLQVLDPNSDRYLEIIEKKYRDTRQMLECRKMNSKRLAKVQMGSRGYSLITFERSLIYELEQNRELEKKFLILSAISDIKSSVKDNASLTRLALLLYREGNIDKSYQYIQFSLEDAVYFNSRLRFIEISNILPVISAAHELQSNAQKSKLQSALLVISLLSVGLLITVFYIYKQVKKLAKAKNALKQSNQQFKALNQDLHQKNDQLTNLYMELSESNHVKEQYIANFLSICSDNINKLDNYRKMVKKMLMARKISELLSKTKSNELIDTEIAEFYQNFDDTFLNIYPNFVEELNALLIPEGHIIPKKGERLSTELRIFALIRLGINDSSRIAQLLRYSVNTIYNYRVKIKNKSAVPRDDFEAHVLKIGAFSGKIPE